MKKKNIKIIAIAIMSLVILAGIVVVGIFGFNKELRYGQGQVINVYVEQMVDVTNIKKLVNECLAGKTNMVQTVEIYQDYVTIKAKEITEDVLNNIRGYAIRLEKGHNEEGILVEMVDMSTKEVKGRVYADPSKFMSNGVSYLFFEYRLLIANSNLGHNGTSSTNR